MIKFGESLSEKQKDELRSAVEKLRRQMLRKSREFDCQILQERMEMLQQAHQVVQAFHFTQRAQSEKHTGPVIRQHTSFQAALDLKVNA